MHCMLTCLSQLMAKQDNAIREVFDVESTVRLDAIQNLTKFQTPPVIDALRKLLKDDDANVCRPPLSCARNGVATATVHVYLTAVLRVHVGTGRGRGLVGTSSPSLRGGQHRDAPSLAARRRRGELHSLHACMHDRTLGCLHYQPPTNHIAVAGGNAQRPRPLGPRVHVPVPRQPQVAKGYSR